MVHEFCVLCSWDPVRYFFRFEVPDTRGEMAILWALVAVGALYLGFAIVRLFIGRRDGMRLGHWRDAGIGLILVGGPLAVLAGAAPWTAAAGVWVLPTIAFLIDRRLFLPALICGPCRRRPVAPHAVPEVSLWTPIPTFWMVTSFEEGSKAAVCLVCRRTRWTL